MQPPYFPIRPDQLAADIRFHDTGDDDFPVGHAKVRSRWVRHVGPTLGYRVELNGASVAYISDHGPGCRDDADDFVPEEILELCDGVDLADPRRAAHGRGVRAEAALGPLHLRLRGARRARGRRQARSRCTTTIPSTVTTPSTRSRRGRPTSRRTLGGPEVVAAAEGMVLDLGRAPRPRDPRVTPARSTWGLEPDPRDLSNGARPFRHRRHDRHRGATATRRSAWRATRSRRCRSTRRSCSGARRRARARGRRCRAPRRSR